MLRDGKDADGRIWELHLQGFTIVRIAPLVGASESHVHGVIVGRWYDDKMKARAERMAARA